MRPARSLTDWVIEHHTTFSVAAAGGEGRLDYLSRANMEKGERRQTMDVPRRPIPNFINRSTSICEMGTKDTNHFAEARRSSYEKMNGKMSSSISLDDMIYHEEADSFEDLLSNTRSKIDILQAQQQEIETFELYFFETRKKVRENAKDLILKIRKHEERLLEEIVANKQSEYAKIGFKKEELDQTIKNLNEAYMEGELLTDDSDDTNKVQQAMVKQLEALDKDSRFKMQALMKFSVLTFSPVRCNTAFGTVQMLDEEPIVNQSPPNSAKKERNPSLPFVSAVEIPKTPAMNKLKSRTVSMSTLLGGDNYSSCPAVVVGPVPKSAAAALAIPKSDQPTRSPMPVRKPSPKPLLKHLQMKELEQEAAKYNSQATCMWSISVDGSEPGQISGPNDVDFLPNGQVVVCDRDNHRVQVFAQTGKHVKIVASDSIKPRRLAVINDGHIAITDSNDSTVKVFDHKDECIIIWGKKWYKSIFKSPCGIAINSKQQPIVSDMEKRTVTIYDEEGKKIKQLQCDGSSKTEFQSPSYVAVDNNDRIIVTDNWSQTVKVFSSMGKFLFQFSKVDHGNRLKYPNGVCADEVGNIYVADWGNHRVSKFDTRGIFIKHVLTKADGLRHPAGIAVYNSRIMAVTAYSDQHSYLALFKLNEDKGIQQSSRA